MQNLYNNKSDNLIQTLKLCVAPVVFLYQLYVSCLIFDRVQNEVITSFINFSSNLNMYVNAVLIFELKLDYYILIVKIVCLQFYDCIYYNVFIGIC